MFAAIQQWALTVATGDFWETIAVLLVIAIAAFIGAFIFLIRKRIIEDTPTSKIRSAAQGYIELNGRSELIEGETIQAPLTQTVCTWYEYAIEKRSGGRRRRWVTVEQGTSKELFRLVDDTGETLIDPEGAAVTPAKKQVWYGSSRHPQQPPQKKKWYSLGFGHFRYTEERMHPGDPLYAIGLFNTDDGPGGGMNINTEVRDMIREWKEDSEKLLEQFDQNGDREIDLQEWQEVRKNALETVKARRLARKALPPVHTLGKTCDTRRPYLLSAVPQPGLVRRYSLFAAGSIAVFLLTGPLVVWLIILRLAG